MKFPHFDVEWSRVKDIFGKEIELIILQSEHKKVRRTETY